jgi:hypothetical protein
MALLITTKKGFINGFVEPQFQEFGVGMMVTVQFSDYDDVRDMKQYLKGDILFDQHSEFFPFTSYITIDDLTTHFPKKKIWSQLQTHIADFSKPPVAYWYEAWYRNEDLAPGDEPDDGFYFGYSLPEDADHIRWGFDSHPDVLNVYPLYEMPKELQDEAAKREEPGLLA